MYIIEILKIILEVIRVLCVRSISYVEGMMAKLSIVMAFGAASSQFIPES
ncbi:hypothetical protein MtrunA17_Chr3g0082191 [Medicago truncatula]|uniref:Uncharacterized protein n=1 Tax=Medicago truncatula TaxID=3880 RepID=A0A396IMS0_MEDTR|nr:hypothetical protein MtrunA17_Chr3g0082191 [Medicago truncatula]